MKPEIPVIHLRQRENATERPVRGFATADWMDAAYECLNYNEYWNGWAIPWFTAETLAYMIEASMNDVTLLRDGAGAPQAVKIIGDGEPQELLTRTFDGATYYAFDGWCFDYVANAGHIVQDMVP